MSDREAARDLCRFVDAAPTPFHAAREVERRLVAAGFSALDEREAWSFEPGQKRYTIRGGAGRPLPALRPTPVTVPATGWITIELHADTGIR